jgi:protein SCO1
MKPQDGSSNVQTSSTRVAPSATLEKSRTWILALTALAVALTASRGWCATDAAPACCAKTESAAASFSDKSLYQTESKWTTDTRTRIRLAALKGRPQVIAMFFANCQYACPIIVNDMKRIEAALKPAMRARVGFTLVTFDTRRDTPEVLAEYRATRQLSAKTWTLLRGESDDVLELAALLGVNYKEDANGQFAHSNVITVLNAEGEIVYQQTGLSLLTDNAVKTLNTLLVK